MTTHMRQTHIDAAATALAGLTTTGANVFKSRLTPLQASELPALILRAGPERIIRKTLPAATAVFERHLQLDVFVFVAAQDELDAALNAIFLEVEPALAVTASGIRTITLFNIDRPTFSQGGQDMVFAAMNYEIVYLSEENAPDVAR